MGAWRTWLRGVKIERGVVSAALAVESFMWAPHYWRVELSLFSVIHVPMKRVGRLAGGHWQLAGSGKIRSMATRQ